MTPANCLYCAARHAKTLKSNYVVAARHAHVIFQGPDLQDAKILTADLVFLLRTRLASARGGSGRRQGRSITAFEARCLRLGLYYLHRRDRHVRRTILKDTRLGVVLHQLVTTVSRNLNREAWCWSA